MANPEDKAQRTAELSTAKRALLEARLRGRGIVAPANRLERTTQPGPHRASFAQERLWFLDRLEPGAPTYNVPAALRLLGDLDADALRVAFQSLVRRHDVLRTTFTPGDDGLPLQRVHDVSEFALPIESIGAGSPEEVDAEVRRRVTAFARAPFDLARGPLLRAELLRLDAQTHVLLVCMHHAVSDGWSVGVLVREVVVGYHAAISGVASPLPALPLQYVDYAVWQREWLSGERLSQQVTYWKEQLAGAPAALDLPTDRARAPTASHQGAQVPLTLSGSLSERLREWSRKEGATLFMTLLAGFGALLSRYSGQRDVVVGSPIAGRTRSELEGLIGFFVNTLALRVRLSPGASARTLLAAVREVTLGAYGHQELPFEKLVEALQVARDASRSPVFQAMLALQNAPLEPVELGGLRVSLLETDAGIAKFDLLLNATDDPAGVLLSLEYATALFEPATAQRMLAHFARLLDSMVARPDSPLESLELLSREEREQLLEGWNDTRVEFADERGLHELFALQVARTPDAIAVECHSDALTYSQLDAESNRLANWLRSAGVGPEVAVGICLERSTTLLVAMLGVLKVGGAYVPIDPGYPRERVEYTLSDAAARVVITERSLRALVSGGGARVFCLEDEVAALAAQSPDCVPARCTPQQLAYIIYTSGSTGRPKGAPISHRNVVRLFRATDAWFGFGPRDVWTLFHSFAFDFSVWEIWGALLYGGRLVVVPYDVSRDPAAFWRLLCDQRVTVLNQTPSAFRQLMVAAAQAPAGATPALRYVIFGGEALELQSLRGWFEQRGDQTPQLVNMYGITETTVHVTYRPIGLRDVEAGRGSVVGRPIPDLQVYILDAMGALAPIGIVGEMYVGGAGLGRGYLNRPELTAERFVPNPFSTRSGERLYRSGDLARRLADGDIEYLGRIDHQVKLRGFRIELGEIEAALSEQPGVEGAIALVREDVPGDRRLVAYVSGESLDTRGLRATLRGRLPEYMVPAAIVALPTLPLTSNGKVDRKALPKPEQDRSAAYEAPREGLEQIVAEAFASVLRIERVGANDGFFALGGHSLLATQLVSKLRVMTGRDLALRTVFEAPTVRAIAERLAMADGTQLAGIERVARSGRLALSFAQERLWFLDKLEPDTATYNMPVALRMTGPLNVEALKRAFDALHARHESLRTTFAEGPEMEPEQRVSPATGVEIPVHDLTSFAEHSREDQATRRTAAFARIPFDLEHGPLLRVELLRLGEEAHLLLVCMHHIVSDGWSMGVLVRELVALYRAFATGVASPLPALPLQYVDYAVWQREWLSGERLSQQVTYWKEQLAGAPAALDLPTDRARAPTASHQGAQVPLTLSGSLSERLREWSRKEGATLFMTLLAGFGALLSRYSGQRDVVVGSPIAGRTRSELEGLIGFFVNTLALRVRLSPGASARTLLAAVREVTLGAYGHQELPFEKLVEALQVARDASRSPVFQAMLILQNAPTERIAIDGLRVTPLPVDPGIAKFDLTLTLSDSTGWLEYSSQLFDRSTIERMAAHLVRLLEHMTARPDAPLASLELLSDAERHQILLEWNQTEQSFDGEMGLHQLFEAQAKRAPAAEAIRFGSESITYGDLDSRANKLARQLRSAGVTWESRVAVCLDRSIELVVALLAVLKAGGAYVPIDPTLPFERVRYMLADSGAAVTICGDDQLTLAGASTVLVLDAATRARVEMLSGETLHRAAGGDSIAYVMYTSGSTGRPKGVAVTHRALVNFMRAMAKRPGLSARDVVLAVTTVSFDIAGLELYLPLSVGGSVVLASRDEGRDGAALSALLDRHQVTTAQMTPASWRMLVASGWRGRADLRMFCGGEALGVDLARELLERGAELWNLFGPTETTIWSTLESIPRGVERITVGTPIDNTQIRIVDDAMRPVPVGIAGELCIAGAGLARGYWGRAELTADRFVPDPAAREVGARMYRTGDLARWRPDGRIEHLGRLDFQVKIRGFRIELGEIEVALAQLSSVRDSVVVARADGSGERRLVAYVVAQAPDAFDVDAVRESLRRALPEYMIPSLFVTLDVLPVNTSGKVDRQALPAPPAGTSAQFTAPEGELESIVARAFERVLGVPRVGAGDDFFALGGHSLLATQLVSALRVATGRTVALRAVFEAPTVRALAARLATSRVGTLEVLTRVDRSRRLPLSFAQERLWFLDRLESGTAAYNMPAALRLEGALELAALRAAFSDLVARHEALRATIAAGVDGVPEQVIHPPGEFDLPVVDIAGAVVEDENAVASRALEFMARPFDLERGPLFRAAVLRVSNDSHVLLVCMHHIVSDAWSVRILVRDFVALYAAHTARSEARLPDLPAQYVDYAAWQRGRLTGATLREQLAYWVEHLAGAPHVLELPFDRRRAPGARASASSLSISVPAALATALHTMARESNCTLFMVLLSVWGVLLGRRANQTDVLIGSPIAGRTMPGTEGIVGIFVNRLALRVNATGNPTVRELLERVRTMALGAFAHQDTPFEQVVDALRPERRLDKSPLVQVDLVLENLPQHQWAVPGMLVALLDLAPPASKVDLSVYCQEPADGSIEIKLVYDSSLLLESSIATLGQQFCTLAEQFAAEPTAPVASLRLNEASDERAMLDAFFAAADLADETDQS